MTGVILLAGDITNYNYIKKYVLKADYIICADGGTSHARKLNVIPDYIVGDMDSIDPELLDKYKNLDVKMSFFNTDKDKTDSHIAIDMAIAKNCDIIYLLGAIGTQLDHSLTNVMLLESIAKRGKVGIIADEYNEMTVINDNIKLKAGNFNRISLIPISQKVTGITTTGLKYTLNRGVLYRNDSMGTSNSFVKENATVKVESGSLLIVKAKE